MIAPSSLAVVSGHDAAGTRPVASKFCLEMARVVSFNSSDTSPRISNSITPPPLASPSDALMPRRDSHESAVHPAANVTVPIYKSETLSLVVGTETKVAVPSANNYPKPVTDASDANGAKESDSLAFHRSQAGRIIPKNRKCSANSVAGRWTASEHEAFLKGLKVYGREWKKVARCIPTRTSAQIRSHAQKYFAKVSKEQQHLLALTEQRRSSLAVGMPAKSGHSLPHHEPRSQSFIETMDSMVSDPAAVEGRVCKTLALLRERYNQLQVQLQQTQAQQSQALAPTARHPRGPAGAAAPLGPASAALETEQESLRQAAAARHAVKEREKQLRHAPVGSTTIEANADVRACVSVTSIPSSYGVFDSSDVIALSRLGGNLGREMEDNIASATKGASSLKLVRERPQLIEQECPTKLRKLGD